ncbi:hypothetical protein [Actinophytocola gossypii]|uniref:hypothetical protein n=1 Tax=Actinophytocola gossypii TaxID=2812003 RepID=UPI0021A8E8B8|nr:hypothetical protein [Actinophytocola gossypii]
MKADDGGDTSTTTNHPRSLEVVRQRLDFGQRVIPPADFEQKLSSSGVRLREPNENAGLVGALADSLSHVESLLVAVQVTQRHSMVDLKQQAQIDQVSVILTDHLPRPLEQR